MKTIVLVCHPNMGQSKLNSVLAKSAEEVAEVRYLYELYPDGNIDVAAEQAVLESADRIVIQFPMYWYSSPALFKEWQDQVLAYGWAHGEGGTALHGKELLIAVTTGAKGSDYQVAGRFGYLVTDMLRPLQATSNLIGTRFIKPFVVTGALTITEQEIIAQGEAYRAYLTNPTLEALGKNN